MRSKAIYPKVYAVIVEYIVQAQRIGRSVENLTPAEWAIAAFRPGKRRYYFKNFILKVKLDSGEELVLDRSQIEYHGKRPKHYEPGLRIKMFHHPRDTREWRYKLLGE